MTGADSHVWLCVLNTTNFEVVKKNRIYAIPNNVRTVKQLKNVKIGDILVFYVKSPVKRVLGTCKVTSRMFEESKMTPWEDRLYPYRLRISHVKEVNVPFKRFVGKIGGIKSRIPMGVSLIPLCKGDLETILGSDFLQRSRMSST